MLEEPVIRRVLLSRYLFELAAQNAQSEQEVASAACVNLLQDAIEVFLLAVLDHVNANVSARTDFPQYLDKISESIGETLPFRRRLLDINKVRVLSKHDGIPPNAREIQGYVSDGRKFLEQTCVKILGTDYWSLTLVQLLDNNDVKTVLLAAESEFKRAAYEECLISCRKAFYILFESDYDTQKDLNNVGILFGSRAPYYARNKDYIEKHVTDPFAYIVLDHGQMDADLTKEGIDHTTFWNVWRLTPQVYRHKEEDEWLVKHEPNKLEEDGIRNRAAHVFEGMVSIALARQSNRRMMKTLGSGEYVVPLRKEQVTVYTKAHKASAIAGVTPKGMTEISASYSTPGLSSEGMFWHVMHLELKPFSILTGYIHEEDLNFD